jgi:CAAX prenyl protease-like protein
LRNLLQSPSAPYVAPMALFLTFLALQNQLKLLGAAEFPLRVTILAAFLWVVSRRVISLRVSRWAGSTAVGIVVFAIWIAPDLLIPGYRQHWLFSNSLLGPASTALPEGLELNPLVLVFRTIRAAILVPIIEELFWRAWLMRWLIRPDFASVPLGAYEPKSFWIVAILFAVEHGPYWEVGLIAGVIYNAWMVKSKSLGDLIWAHGVTNLLLSLYIIVFRQWQYWM